VFRGAGSNVKRREQPFQKGASFFWAAIFVKTLLYGYSITCGYYGSANYNINFEQFIRCTVPRAEIKSVNGRILPDSALILLQLVKY
jgi:hypothetical protein